MARRFTGMLALAALMGTAPALAADTGVCEDLATAAGKRMLVVTGSTALGPLLKVMGPKLADQGIFVVYNGNGSCTGVNNIVDPANAPLAQGLSMTYYNGYDQGAAGTPPTCSLGAKGVSNLGISDVFVKTCTR